MNERALKKASSFNQLIPSEDFTTDEYGCFLSFSTSYELEWDIVSQDTYYKICKFLKKPIPKPNFPIPRKILP